MDYWMVSLKEHRGKGKGCAAPRTGTAAAVILYGQGVVSARLLAFLRAPGQTRGDDGVAVLWPRAASEERFKMKSSRRACCACMGNGKARRARSASVGVAWTAGKVPFSDRIRS